MASNERPKRWTRRAGVGVAVATLLSAGVATANAWGPVLPCTNRPVSKPFQRFGDSADYMMDLAANTNFERGTAEWMLSPGATIVTDNEPWKVGSASDSKSLRLAPGARAESRAVCITAGEEKIRFFAKPESPNPDPLVVEFVGRDPKSGFVGRMTFTINPATLNPKQNGWAPTPVIWVPDALNARIRQLPYIEGTMIVKAGNTPWRIDGIYLDPFRPR